MLPLLRQAFNVDDILSQIKCRKHCSESLSSKVKSGVECVTEKRHFLVKVFVRGQGQVEKPKASRQDAEGTKEGRV